MRLLKAQRFFVNLPFLLLLQPSTPRTFFFLPRSQKMLALWVKVYYWFSFEVWVWCIKETAAHKIKSLYSSKFIRLYQLLLMFVEILYIIKYNAAKVLLALWRE